MIRIITMAALASLWFLPTLPGQETQEMEVVAEPSGGIVIATTETAGDPNSSSRQTQIMSFDASDMGGGAFFLADAGHMMLGSDPLSMLNNPSVQKDLALVEDQLAQIRSINEEFSEKIKSAIHSDEGGLKIKDPHEMSQIIEDLRKSQQEQIDQVLLPHQQDRLQQVSLQMQLKNSGTAQTLSGQLAEKLGITPEQKQRLQKRSEELQKQIDEKLKQLRADAKKQLLDELTSAQRKKLEELIGDEFTPKSEDSEHRFPGKMRFGPPPQKDF